MIDRIRRFLLRRLNGVTREVFNDQRKLVHQFIQIADCAQKASDEWHQRYRGLTEPLRVRRAIEFDPLPARCVIPPGEYREVVIDVQTRRLRRQVPHLAVGEISDTQWHDLAVDCAQELLDVCIEISTEAVAQVRKAAEAIPCPSSTSAASG